MWRNRRRTIITLSSIVLGLMFFLLMVCLAEGVYAKLVDEAVRMQGGHVTIMHPRYLDAPSADLFVGQADALRPLIAKLRGVERTKGLVIGQGLVKTATGAVGVMVMGVEPVSEMEASPLPKRMRRGRYLAGNAGAEAVVGVALAERLKLKVGKKLVLAANDAHGQMVEELCRVRGIFGMDSDEMDGYLIQVPIGFARRLYGLPPGGVTYLGVVLGNPDDRHRVAGEIAAMPGAKGVSVLVWEKVLPEIASYIRLDRTSNWIFQLFLIFLVLFTIFNTMLMSVLERNREFGVLLALGTTPGRLRAQVFLEALFLNILGCAGGLLLGSAVVGYYMVYGMDITKMTSAEMSISGFSFGKMLYPRLTGTLLGWVGGLVFAATLVLSLIPVWRSARIRVAEVLR